jgi:hypothetical protein
MQTVKGPIWASFFTSPVLLVPTICLQTYRKSLTPRATHATSFVSDPSF